jgi:hypothetical protein
MQVSFFHPYRDEVMRLRHGKVDMDRDWRWVLASPRQGAWILQTYLRLREAGCDVRLTADLPEDGIMVLGPGNKQRDAFLERYTAAHRRLVLVQAVADAGRSFLGDVSVYQNGKYADGRTAYSIPHWPQPGLQPRDLSRGDAVQVLAYKGDDRNLGDSLDSAAWKEFIQKHDLTWRRADDQQHWACFQDVDLIIAVRASSADPYLRKPATKLINAWHAGVPALLGPEYAYRELRQSNLDYLEVRSLDDVMQGVRYLIEHPERYRAMIENGRRRAEAFSVEATTERWVRLLFETIPQRIHDGKIRTKQRWPLPLRRAANLVRHPPHVWEWRLWAYSLKERLHGGS